MLPPRRPKLIPPPSEGAVSYAVGYKKPPVQSRFPKGRSGNPQGRPRGAPNRAQGLDQERLRELIVEEAYRMILVNDGDRQLSISTAQAVVRALAINAARGQHRSQQLFTRLLTETERANQAMHAKWFETAVDYKNSWERELQRRKELGIVAPDPVPHPDNIIIDPHFGTATVRGPMTKEEAAKYEALWKVVRAADEAIAYCEENLPKTRNKKKRAELESLARMARRKRKQIVDAIGEPR